MSNRDFETEFWDIVAHNARRDHIVRRWASRIVEEETNISFIELPQNFYGYLYDNFGLNAERATRVLELSKEDARGISDGQA